jgi:hypothetical protein
MTIKTNLSEVVTNLIAQMNEQLGRQIAREVAVSLKPVIAVRIHQEGKDASGEKIGTYKPSYLELRVSKYKRTADPTVILSLTKQMENDFSVQETQLGYGLGYNNPLNYQKAQWNELRFNKLIFGLTNEEQLIANEVAQIAMTNALSK